MALALGGCAKNTNESESRVPEVPAVVLDQTAKNVATFGPVAITKRYQVIKAGQLRPSGVPGAAEITPAVAIYRPDQLLKDAPYGAQGTERIYSELSIPPGRYMVAFVGDGEWRLTITETATPPR